MYNRELNLVLCDNLEGWDGMGWGGDEGHLSEGDICILMAEHIVVWQKPAQHCKAQK